MFINLKSLLFLLLGINVFIFVGYNYNILAVYKPHRSVDTLNLHVRGTNSLTGSEHADEVTKEQVLEELKELEDQSFQIHLKKSQLRNLLEQIEIKGHGEALSGELELQKARFGGSTPFEIFDAYKEVELRYFDRRDNSVPKFNETLYGILHDEEYCLKTDLYNLQYQDHIFEQMTIFTDFPKGTLPAEAMKVDDISVLEDVGFAMGLANSVIPSIRFPYNITNFYTSHSGLYEYHKIGQHFTCATQMYNHIPGHGHFYRKDQVLNQLVQYTQNFKDHPQCFQKGVFFLPAFRLYVKEECQEFFRVIQSDEYRALTQTGSLEYLIKIGQGAHKSQGVFLLDESQTDYINNKYQNGARCGEDNENLLAQKYIDNPLLLDKNNKFDFRIFMLLASTNPFMAYYHDGYLRVSLTSFDLASKDRATHLTNTAVASKVLAEAKNQNKTLLNMTAEDAKDYHLWHFQDLQDYLLESGKVTDPNWLDNYLRPLFHKFFIHLIQMSKQFFLKQSNVYELYGLDFMLDENLNLWYIETNSSPLLSGVKPDLIGGMLADLLEVQFALYRARMNRVIDLVKRMEKEIKNDGVVDQEKWRQEYQQAVKNQLDPEFEISKENKFVLIFDETRPQDQVYLNNLPSECYNILQQKINMLS